MSATLPPLAAASGITAPRGAASAVPLPAIAALWLAPVLLTVLSAGNAAILAMTLIAAGASTAANLARPHSIVVTLPFFALLSPMTGLLDIGGARLVFSDLLFGLLAVQAVVMAIVQRVGERPRLPLMLPVLGLLFALGVVAGTAAGYLVSLKPILYLAQYAILALFTATYATRADDWLTVQRAWVVASVFGAAILLQAYGEGRNLDNLKDSDAVSTLSSPDDLLVLFRASYYYSGFHYILGLCVVWVGTRLLFPARVGQRLLMLAALALLLAALVATVNKTALAAVVFALVVTAAALFVRFRREMSTALTWFAALGAAALVFASWQFAQLAENTQIELILDRIFSASSLLSRLEVYVQAIDIWSSSPWTLALGFGPDFLDNSGAPLYADALKTSPSTGYAEGTVDSAWLSYLIEFGLPGLVLLAALFAIGIVRSARGLRHCARPDAQAFANASLLGGLMFLTVAMTTQMLGYSKTSWLPFQLMVVAAIGLHPRARAG